MGDIDERETLKKFEAAINRLLRQHAGDGLAEPAARLPVLPDRPAFEEIEKAAAATAQDRNAFFQLIGQLVFSWSNNESMLVYVLMLLLGTDEQAAAAVFATLNTTRARLDLVRRLVILKIPEGPLRRDLEALAEGLAEASRVRNELLHAMYAVDGDGRITHTQAMRFVEKRGRLSFGDRQPVDQARMAELKKIGQSLQSLNRVLWDLLPRLREALSRSSSGRQV
jgi:hypothetical protein